MVVNVIAVGFCEEITVCNARIAVPALNGSDLANYGQAVSSGVVCDHTVPAQTAEERAVQLTLWHPTGATVCVEWQMAAETEISYPPESRC